MKCLDPIFTVAAEAESQLGADVTCSPRNLVALCPLSPFGDEGAGFFLASVFLNKYINNV